MSGRVPALHETTIEAAKAWFSAIHTWSGGGWHADDSAADLDCFEPGEAAYVDECMTRLREAAAQWPDPQYLYDLCAQGPAQADRIWPGFTLDVSLDSGRIGNPSLAGRTLPNFVFEDCDRFFMIEFGEPSGEASSQTDLRLYEVDDARFTPRRAVYTDLSHAVVNEASRIDFDNLQDGFRQALATLMARGAPAPR